MKLHHLLLLILVLQVLLILPIQRSYQNLNHALTEEEIFKSLYSSGIGPAYVLKSGSVTITDPAPSGVGGMTEHYYAYYLRNAMLNVLSAVCVFQVFTEDRREKG